MLINCCKDSYKKRKTYENLDNISDTAISDFNVEDYRFYDIVRNLVLIEKKIMTLHYYNELTFEEISKVLAKPLSTVKSRHYRALQKLKKDWGEYNE
jgi:RNA polymerase sigma-70 factor (ECF subfamily)